MKNLLRILLAFFVFAATFYFVYWVPLILIAGYHKTVFIPIAVSFLLAVICAFFIWKKTGSLTDDLATYILKGGIIVGGISFFLGFVGPIIFTPSANQGPLLGIFITGPIGFVLGLIGGGLFWMFKKLKNKQLKED